LCIFTLNRRFIRLSLTLTKLRRIEHDFYVSLSKTNRKNRSVSAKIWPISTKFGTIIQDGFVTYTCRWKILIMKIQDDRWAGETRSASSWDNAIFRFLRWRPSAIKKIEICNDLAPHRYILHQYANSHADRSFRNPTQSMNVHEIVKFLLRLPSYFGKSWENVRVSLFLDSLWQVAADRRVGCRL